MADENDKPMSERLVVVDAYRNLHSYALPDGDDLLPELMELEERVGKLESARDEMEKKIRAVLRERDALERRLKQAREELESRESRKQRLARRERVEKLEALVHDAACVLSAKAPGTATEKVCRDAVPHLFGKVGP